MTYSKSVSVVKRALRIEQDSNRVIYLFSLRGHELTKLADISRLSRDGQGKLIGFQRPEVKKHVSEIADYLNSNQVLFPNSIILALSSAVKFRSSRGPGVNDGDAVAGTIEIPLPASSTSRKPAWIVDGQQRALALDLCERKDLPIPISAFVSDEIELQRDQFIRVNNTKPLPRSLISELLPEVDSPLPTNMSVRKIPSALVNWLNEDVTSPFFGIIRRASTPKEALQLAVVTDSSLIKMLEESLLSPSACLFPYRNVATGQTDFEGVCLILKTYWSAVKIVFDESWGLPPSKSRLMHGAGIRAMGRLMNRIMAGANSDRLRNTDYAESELRLISPYCRWTEGVWEELGGLYWNEIQNVHRHISLLSNFLIRKYLEVRMAKD